MSKSNTLNYIHSLLLSFIIYSSTSQTQYDTPTPTLCPCRCGLNWSDANAKCGQCCQIDDDCTENLNETCYADLDQSPCTQITSYSARCGTSWIDANTKCGQCCTIDAHCTENTNEQCYTDLDQSPCINTPTTAPSLYPINTLSSCGTGKRVSLTLDDGPAEVNDETLTILNALDKYDDVKITFFISPAAWGDDITALNKRCALIPEIIKRGHEIQSHSWSHPDFAWLDPDTDYIVQELDKTRDWIIACGGVAPTIFRPPYGALTKSQVQFIVHEYGYVISLWNLDSQDWRQPNNSTAILNDIDITLYDPEITSINLLMHDRNVYLIIDDIVQKFRDAGYQFILQSECWAQCDTLDADGVCMDYTPSDVNVNLFPHNPKVIESWRSPNEPSDTLIYDSKAILYSYTSYSIVLFLICFIH